MMMMATATVNKDNDKDTNGKDNNDLIFGTTTNLWSDAFLAGRGGYFDDDDAITMTLRQSQRQQRQRR